MSRRRPSARDVPRSRHRLPRAVLCSGLVEESAGGGEEKCEKRSVHLTGIGPGRKSCHQIELSQDVADNSIRLAFGAQAIDLRHDLGQRGFDVVDRALRVVLTLRIEAALTARELFSIETGKRMENGVARRPRISQEAGKTFPQRGHDQGLIPSLVIAATICQRGLHAVPDGALPDHIGPHSYPA